MAFSDRNINLQQAKFLWNLVPSKNFLGCIFNCSGSDDPQAARLKLNLTDKEASEE